MRALCGFMLLLAAAVADRPGQCPTPPPGVCLTDKAPCGLDEDCPATTDKCCPTSCGTQCMKPIYSGCEQLRLETRKRARALGVSVNSVTVPECSEKGDFEQIQCNTAGSTCWCVDELGFELPGTRRARDLVNCSDPKPCSGHTCRMLCPYGFELSNDGCPICQCRDPCSDVKCPGKLTCQLENIPCSKEPCPPIPKCKKGRSLENVCPYGQPLTIPDSRRPFLCGNTPGKPQCPPMFRCDVDSGNDYGVCCPSSVNLQKPGVCPSKDTEEQLQCGMHCEHDLECPSMHKCCDSENCGKHCSYPQNVTVCLQQKMLAELLIINEREGKGYVPQCSSDSGEFLPKQCSRNGLVCWCVNSKGDKLPGSMGPNENVICSDKYQSSEQGRSISNDPVECDQNICAQVCEYGFKVNDDGCPTCECDDPCQGFICDDGKECHAVKEPGCDGPFCQSYPECQPAVIYVNPCSMGNPLTDPITGNILACGSQEEEGVENNCPFNSKCTTAPGTIKSVCCPNILQPDVQKNGMCPFLKVENCQNETLCDSDRLCPGLEKCCFSDNCGDICVEPLSEISDKQDVDTEGLENAREGRESPTMCEYLRDFSEKMEGTRHGMRIAIPPPSCHSNGSFTAKQCSNSNGEKTCWCVDEFGTEIPLSRGKDENMNCEKLREELDCLGLTCRIFCDYGFNMDVDTRCPKCSCRNPCDDITCSSNEECLMVDVNCEDDYCPPVPACLPKKPGQCPYLVPVQSGSCDYECKSDYNCNGSSKCCSNGCGTQCVETIMLTACQHHRAIFEHKAHELGVPARQIYLPQCRESDGGYEQVQCHPGTKVCWCVNERGEEMSGTRAPPDVQPSCQAPRTCPLLKCAVCEHGYKLDADGCQTCECSNPCDNLTCRGEGETCRLIEVQCIDQPCPPVPMCLPKIENPCQIGNPLLYAGGTVRQCGPQGELCPSSHKCHLSPFGEYAVCCPKPRDVCFEPKDEGTCNTNPELRWYFNPSKNKCEEFTFGGCGGNQNSFESEKICNTVCPVLSQCERLREKNQQSASKYSKSTFLPRCAPDTGLWLPVQCLDQVGVCWCVTPDGDPIKGTLVRGSSPPCSSRQARKRMFNNDNVLEELLKEALALAMSAAEDSITPSTSAVLLSTRCQTMRDRMTGTNSFYTVECDAAGRFAPTQCYPQNSEKFPECWCVDEAGNQLPNTTTFRRGAKICLPTPIQSVDVALSFPGHLDSMKAAVAELQLKQILDKFGSMLKDNEMIVELRPDVMLTSFALTGSNKVDIAYYLEEMVKSGQLNLNINGNKLTADITRSHFNYHLTDESALPYHVIALEHREVVSESTVSPVTPYHTAIIILCVSSAFIIFILVILMMFYRRKIHAARMNESTKISGLSERFLSQTAPVFVVSLPDTKGVSKSSYAISYPQESSMDISKVVQESEDSKQDAKNEKTECTEQSMKISENV